MRHRSAAEGHHIIDGRTTTQSMALSAPNDPEPQVWRRAYELFEEALDLPAEVRESFATRRASGDSGLLSVALELIRNASEDDREQALPGAATRVGSRIGRYEITHKLGSGAMGHVYAARDTELGRMVALKFLATGSGSSGDEQGANPADRLVREAKAASALNHPNIVTVYDVIRCGADVALAMELVEGESLRPYCGAPLPLARAVHWGRQIAQALDATHACGIVHGDVKPENVMVRPDGYIKVLDFGLARRVRLSLASTHSTAFGALAGTLGYLSPEQTRGESPTVASDVFSLGVMFYELICGWHPFRSASPIDTAYAIAHHAPKAPRNVRPDVPAALSRLIVDMIAKDPAQRPGARQVEAGLAALERAEKPRVRKAVWILAACAACVAAAGAAGTWQWRHGLFGPKPLALEPVTRLLEKDITASALAPDGSLLAYALVGGPVYLRRMSDGNTRTLPAPPDLRASRIAWFQDGRRLLLSGTQGADGTPGLWVLPADRSGPPPILVTQPGRDGVPSPDGRRIAMKSADGSAVWVMDVNGGNQHILRAAGTNTLTSLVWSPDGKRVSCLEVKPTGRTPDVYRFRFLTLDASSGSEVSEVDDLPLSSATALPDGRIVGLPWAFPATSHGGELLELRTDPATGAYRGVSRRAMPDSEDGVFSNLSVSRDGATMALLSASEFVNVYTADVFSGKTPSLSAPRRVTFALAQDYPHAWTVDGRALLFESNRDGKFDLFRIGLEDKEPTGVYASAQDSVQPIFTPDGKWILFRRLVKGSGAVLMRVAADGGGVAVPVPVGGMTGEEQACGSLPGARCVIRSREAEEYVDRELDPVRGAGRVLARTPNLPHLIFDWSLSPDGRTIAAPNHDTRSAVIRLTPLDGPAGGGEKLIRLEGMRNLSAVTWSADGKGLFVSVNTGSGGVLLYADLAGHTTKLMESSKVIFAVVSPDGRHIAYPEHVMSSNVQLLKPAE